MSGNNRIWGKVKHLVIHTTATPAGRWVSPEDVIRWHTAPKPYGYGWNRVGYNLLILLDGVLPTERDLFVDNPNCIVRVLKPINFDEYIQDSELVYHAGPSYNPISHAICYVGGMSSDFKRPLDTRTETQVKAMEFIVKYFVEQMTAKNHHDFTILGHNQIDNKACPGFFVPCWLEEIGIPKRYINYNDPYGYKRYFNNLYKSKCYGARKNTA